MIPSSDLYRIPRADSRARLAEAERYARLEFGEPRATWLLAAARAAQPRRPGILARVAALFRRPSGRGARAPGAARPLRSSLAAVHFGGDEAAPARVHATRHEAERGRGAPHGVLLLTTLEADCEDDACTCGPSP